LRAGLARQHGGELAFCEAYGVRVIGAGANAELLGRDLFEDAVGRVDVSGEQVLDTVVGVAEPGDEVGLEVAGVGLRQADSALSGQKRQGNTVPARTAGFLSADFLLSEMFR